MRILLIASYAPSLLNFRGPFIKALLEYGHEVFVTAPSFQPELKNKLESLGVTVLDIPLQRQGMNIFFDILYFFRLIKLFKKISPDLVFTYTIKPNIWGAFAGAINGTRTISVITGLGYAFTDSTEPFSQKNMAVKKVARMLYRNSTKQNWRVVFQNRDDLADFETAGCLSDRSKVLLMNGSGIDLDQYPPAPLPTGPNFLMISRILGSKGVREYARAAILVKKVYPQAHFRLVGFFDDGPDAISEAEVAKWQKEGLEYLGPSENVQVHLSACQVYVLPSYREGTPRSVLEAMATGRAILTSDAPGCRETVIDGKNGFLIPIRDVEALSQKMIYLIEHPQLVSDMGEASLEIVQDKYDVKKVNQRLLKDLDLI